MFFSGDAKTAPSFPQRRCWIFFREPDCARCHNETVCYQGSHLSIHHLISQSFKKRMLIEYQSNRWPRTWLAGKSKRRAATLLDWEVRRKQLERSCKLPISAFLKSHPETLFLQFLSCFSTKTLATIFKHQSELHYKRHRDLWYLKVCK